MSPTTIEEPDFTRDEVSPIFVIKHYTPEATQQVLVGWKHKREISDGLYALYADGSNKPVAYAANNGFVEYNPTTPEELVQKVLVNFPSDVDTTPTEAT